MALHNYIGPNRLTELLTKIKTWVLDELPEATSAVSASVNATSATVTNAAIKTTSLIDIYCETSSGKPVTIKQVTVTTGQAVLSFDALTEAASFKLLVR